MLVSVLWSSKTWAEEHYQVPLRTLPWCYQSRLEGVIFSYTISSLCQEHQETVIFICKSSISRHKGPYSRWTLVKSFQIKPEEHNIIWAVWESKYRHRDDREAVMIWKLQNAMTDSSWVLSSDAEISPLLTGITACLTTLRVALPHLKGCLHSAPLSPKWVSPFISFVSISLSLWSSSALGEEWQGRAQEI